MRALSSFLVGVALLTAGQSVPAGMIIYDFEDLSEQHDLTELVYEVDGLTMTLSRSEGLDFDIDDRTDMPTEFGTLMLDPFDGTGDDSGTDYETGDTWVANFSAPILGFSADFGDFNQDADTPVTAHAYAGLDGMGSLIDDDSAIWLASDSFPNFKTLSVGGAGIRSVVFTSNPTGNFPNSLFWDNIAVTVPTPSSLALFGMGAAGLLGFRRRRRQSATEQLV